MLSTRLATLVRLFEIGMRIDAKPSDPASRIRPVELTNQRLDVLIPSHAAAGSSNPHDGEEETVIGEERARCDDL